MANNTQNNDLSRNDGNIMLAEAQEQIISYIENDAEIAIPINEIRHESGRSLTKKNTVMY